MAAFGRRATPTSAGIELALVAFLLAPLTATNWVATRLVFRDEVISRKQRIAQALVVWLIPIIGAVLVFAVHRRAEPPSRKYREAPDPGDDFGLSGQLPVQPITQTLMNDPRIWHVPKPTASPR